MTDLVSQHPAVPRRVSPSRSFPRRFLSEIAPEAIYGIWLRDLKKFWRERSRLWGGIARPILWLLILVQRQD